MTDWQPIETAPKTGCYVLLARDHGLDDMAMEGYWRDEINEGRFPAGWVMSIDPDTSWPVEPTHWMPLPEPPA